MQKFFTDTIESSFIKELVYSANIPSYDSVSDGDYAFKDVTYIYKNHIIKVTKSGVVGSGAEFYNLCTYKFNERISKVTENYISRYNYYDSETHYQLGRYLRLYRDCTGVDLMPFYNCYSGKIVSDVYLGDHNEVRFVGDNKFTTNTSEYKIILVPIRFNKEYTICIDSYSKVRMKPIFYGSFGIDVNTPFPENDMFGNTETDYQSMSFKEPKLYKLDLNSITYTYNESENYLTDTDKTNLMSYEKNLYLLIQLPINNKSSILVQEGNYTNVTRHYDLFDTITDESTVVSGERYIYKGCTVLITDTTVGSTIKTGAKYKTVSGSNLSRVYNEEFIDKLTNNELNNILLSDLQLQRLSTGESYAFSTRLIEYLLDNVITSEDQFDGDIRRVQKVLREDDMLISTGYQGVWDRSIRSALFRKYISSGKTTGRSRSINDINGFVDKDVEDYLSVLNNRHNG